MQSTCTNLLVLLRGVPFRSFGRARSQNALPAALAADTQPQFDALASVRDDVLLPAAQRGWNTTVLADLVVPHSNRSAWQRGREIIGHAIAHERLSPAFTASTQSGSLLNALAWVTRIAPRHWKARDVLLLVRIDLHFKSPLPAPPAPACDDRCIWLPFSLSTAESGCTSPIKLSVADTVIWLPREPYSAFVEAARGRITASGRRYPPNNLHSIWMAAPVALLLPHVNADADTLVDANPLYFMLGRARGTRVRPGCSDNSTAPPVLWPACACSESRKRRCAGAPRKEACCRAAASGLEATRPRGSAPRYEHVDER